MSTLEDGGAFSLADLSELDITDIEEIRYENLPAGLYGFEVKEATLSEKDNKDGDNRIIATFKLEVVTVESVIARGVDADSLVGKSHTEKAYIVPDQGPQKVAEGVGRLRAFIKDMGAPNEGKLANVVAATVGHQFTAPIVERPNPNDRTSPYAQLKLKKAA